MRKENLSPYPFTVNYANSSEVFRQRNPVS